MLVNDYSRATLIYQHIIHIPEDGSLPRKYIRYSNAPIYSTLEEIHNEDAPGHLDKINNKFR